MFDMLRDLILHKGYANAALIKAIREHGLAAENLELKKLVHHIILANRYWLRLILTLPFNVEEESRIPESLEAIKALYQETHAQEVAWISQVQEHELAQMLETPFIPGLRCSVAQAVTQVCLHSQGHRAQCSSMLRSLGGEPPTLDFILWLKDRPDPDWD